MPTGCGVETLGRSVLSPGRFPPLVTKSVICFPQPAVEMTSRKSAKILINDTLRKKVELTEPFQVET